MLTTTTHPYPTWDKRLFLSILALLIVPSIYRSYSVYLIGNTPPDQQNLAIVAQWQFVQVALEVLQEALIFPLFYLVGSVATQSSEQLFRRVRSSIMMLALILAPVLLVLVAGMPLFVEAIGTETSLRTLTVQFLQIRTSGIALSLFSAGLIIMVEVLRKPTWLWQLTGLKLLLSVLLDSLFFGGYTISLGWGVLGLAWSQLLVEAGVLVFVFWRLSIYFGKDWRAYFQLPRWEDWTLLSQIGSWVALESLIRNLAYWILILRLINILGGEAISGYYLAIHLFWSFALVPIQALVETMRVLIARAVTSVPAIRTILRNGCTRGGLFLLGWLLALPFLHSILSFFTSDPQIITFGRQAIYYLFPAYLILATTLLIDSLFIGLGQTRYLAYKSILTNTLVYGSAYLAYRLQWWVPDFSSILLLFGLGIVVGNGLTIFYARRLLVAEISE